MLPRNLFPVTVHQLEGVYAVKVCVMCEPNYWEYFEDHLFMFPYLFEMQVCEMGSCSCSTNH
jgi:hypothetical protein